MGFGGSKDPISHSQTMTKSALSNLPRNPATSVKPGYCVDSDAPAVRNITAKLTARCRDARERARRLFDFVRDEIRYNFAPDVHQRRDFKASHTLELGNGFCMQKAALYAALCRASGIPARIGFQDLVDYKITGQFRELMGTNELSGHGMNAVYLDGRWLAVDCTLDRGLVERKNYRLVEFDGLHDALLPKTDRAGKPHFEILKQRGFYNDTPLFAIRTMLDWIDEVPYDDWKRLVHGRDGSM
jgi:transglutaminase-like putative cysteine protease